MYPPAINGGSLYTIVRLLGECGVSVMLVISMGANSYGVCLLTTNIIWSEAHENSVSGR